jgi:hypothetical protein
VGGPRYRIRARVRATDGAHTAGALLDAAGVAAGTRLLDVGTGPGVAEAAARNVPGADVRVAVLPDLPLPRRRAAGVRWPDDIPRARSGGGDRVGYRADPGGGAASSGSSPGTAS